MAESRTATRTGVKEEVERGRADGGATQGQAGAGEGEEGGARRDCSRPPPQTYQDHGGETDEEEQ